VNTTSEKPANNQVAEKRVGKRASTAELPLVDLGVVLEFVHKIETKGLQTLSGRQVAERLGYAAPTSTPFYRRMVAAKLFGLLDTAQGVNLTGLALDYFKPTDEESSKNSALAAAIKNVVGYRKILERYAGKRVPQVDILTHLIEREFDLVPEAAKVCASVFASSVQRAQLVQADGTVNTAPSEAPRHSAASEPGSGKTATAHSTALALPLSDDLESHYLTLDAKRGRRVILQGPPVITASELKRIQSWLAVQFHIVEGLERSAPAQATAAETDSDNNTPTAS